MPDSSESQKPSSVTNTGPGAVVSGGGVAAGAGGIAVGGNVYGGLTISTGAAISSPTPSAVEPQPDSLASCLIRIFRADGTPVGAGFLAHGRQALTCAHVVGAALSLKRDRVRSPRLTHSGESGRALRAARREADA